MKLGFSADDLRSKEQFFKRLGEITVAKIPQNISLKEITSHPWSNPTKYEHFRAAFEALGFRRAGTFVGSPQGWVVEFWLSGEPGLFAKISDSKACGVYSEVTVMNRDGVLVSFENTEECGLKHREPDTWVHCGRVTPAHLIERALPHRQPNAKQLNLDECVNAYVQSVNENLTWRRGVGITATEAREALRRRKKRAFA
ncbi:MAG TPA: hypothetical protein VFE61_00810 [Candidatus Sulfotelmatobacter sp.]|jgi:hypothetical protein|nr:hypothetical protein [Candidatus Sulfotelmatobacter sp.]